MLSVVVATCVLAGGGGIHLFRGYSMGKQLIWENDCDYLDRRCALAAGGGSNLRGAMICGWGGLLTLGGRSPAQCRVIVEHLEGKAKDKEPPVPRRVHVWKETENIRAAPNGKILRTAEDGEVFEVLDSIGKWWKIKLAEGGNGYIWKNSVVKIDK